MGSISKRWLTWGTHCCERRLATLGAGKARNLRRRMLWCGLDQFSVRVVQSRHLRQGQAPHQRLPVPRELSSASQPTGALVCLAPELDSRLLSVDPCLSGLVQMGTFSSQAWLPTTPQQSSGAPHLGEQPDLRDVLASPRGGLLSRKTGQNRGHNPRCLRHWRAKPHSHTQDIVGPPPAACTPVVWGGGAFLTVGWDSRALQAWLDGDGPFLQLKSWG